MSAAGEPRRRGGRSPRCERKPACAPGRGGKPRRCACGNQSVAPERWLSITKCNPCTRVSGLRPARGQPDDRAAQTPPIPVNARSSRAYPCTGDSVRRSPISRSQKGEHESPPALHGRRRDEGSQARSTCSQVKSQDKQGTLPRENHRRLRRAHEACARPGRAPGRAATLGEQVKRL